jgi:hypothetical protein
MTTAEDIVSWKRYRDAEGPVARHSKRKRDYLAGLSQGREIEKANATLQGLIDLADRSPYLFRAFCAQNPDLIQLLRATL